MSKKTVSFQVPIEEKRFDEICAVCLPTVPRCELKHEGNGFSLKEKIDLLGNTNGVQATITYDNYVVVIAAKCIGIGPIQQQHVDEVVEVIQNVIQRGIDENTTVLDNSVVRCPKCGSTQIQLSKRGWSLATGLIGSSRNERVCMNCLYKF